MDILSAVKDYKRIAIGGHIRPDGDCIGSCLAVYNYILDNTEGKEVHVFLNEIPDLFKFLKNSDKIEEPGRSMESFDLFICLDCGDIKRLGGSEAYFKEARHTFCIDHHIQKGSFADINDVDPENSSTCEMVFDRMDKDLIDEKIAECLYSGMVTDTGVFQYSCTKNSTMKAAGFLMDKGIPYPEIVNKVFFEKTFEQNQVLGYALMNAELYLDGRVIVSYIPADIMKKYHALPKHMEGIGAALRSTKGVEISVFAYDTLENTLKVSLRAGDTKVNLSDLAGHFGGGGHAKASGCMARKPFENFKDKVLELIAEEI